MDSEIKKYQDHINYLEDSLSMIKSSMSRWMFELNDANETIKKNKEEIDNIKKDYEN